MSFQKHLTVIKDFYGEPRTTKRDGESIVVPLVLDKFRLESKQPLFIMAMLH